MRPHQPLLLKDRAAHLSEWLRRQLWKSALSELAEGMLFAAFGALIVGITFAFPFLMLFSVVDGAVGSAGVENNFTVLLVALLISSGVLAYSFYCVRDRSRGFYVPANGEDITNSALSEILLAGPIWCISAFDCFAKSARLLRLIHRDLMEVATIFVWLFDKGRKGTAEEIGNSLLGADAVRILPLLRDIPGVIWLTYYYGVIILSEELRREIGRQLRETPPRPKPPQQAEPEPEPEPQPAEEENTEPAQEYPYGAEAVDWYKTLGLAPFTPLAIVRKRYRQLVKIHHPDAAASKNARQGSDEQIKRINSAYHNILDYSKRKG